VTGTDLNSRLSEFEAHLHEAVARQKLKNLLSCEHQLTPGELATRHKVLTEEMAREIAAVEAQGRHVGPIEHSVRYWLDSLELETV